MTNQGHAVYEITTMTMYCAIWLLKPATWCWRGIWSSLVVWWRIPLWHSCAELPHGNGKFPFPRGNRPHVIFFASPRWVCRGSKLNQSHVKLQSSLGVKRFSYITLYYYIHLCHSRKRKKEWNKSASKPWRRGPAAKHQTWAWVTPWMQPMNELGQVRHSISQTLQVSNDTCLTHTVVKDEAANYSVLMCFQQMVLWRQRPAKGLKTPAVSVCFKAEEIERRRKAEEEFLGA